MLNAVVGMRAAEEVGGGRNMVCERMGKLDADSCESCQSHACLLFLYNHLFLSIGEISMELKRRDVPGSFLDLFIFRMENNLDGGRMENLSGWEFGRINLS